MQKFNEWVIKTISENWLTIMGLIGAGILILVGTYKDVQTNKKEITTLKTEQQVIKNSLNQIQIDQITINARLRYSLPAGTIKNIQ